MPAASTTSAAPAEQGSRGSGHALEKLFSLAVVTHQFMEAGLTERGLSRARATVLWNLRRGGPMPQRALAAAIEVSPRNVTGLVDALEADGFVARAPHPHDRRAVLVDLTDQGRATVEALGDEYDQGAAWLFAGVEERDLAGFVTVVDHLLEQITRHEC
ncbi:MarR family winged helix-turn-helix transcriptional regulator [Actinomadura kijaniata]|uniref:MarR family winged helix-turn-helix transcriptional regulator n=1 Tax=Actinomadura kijaniata TaxID=46161 RepID=UPI000B21C16D|nr:MarR family transcriptional regulator [Actinomadura kijaniata]